MKLWFSASEIADLALPGLPMTRQGINKLVERENWQSSGGRARQRSGRGGGWEYHIEILPPKARLAYASRFVDCQPTVDMVSAAPTVGDARLVIIATAARFQTIANLSQTVTDGVFCDLFNAGSIGVDDWVKEVIPKISQRSIARWRSAVASGDMVRLGDQRGGNRAGKSLLAAAFEGRVATHIGALLVRQPHLTARHIRDLIKAEFGGTLDVVDQSTGETETKPLPPLRTFQHFISRYKEDNAVVLSKLTDPDKFKSSYRIAGITRHSKVERVNQVWEVDASPADVLTTDGRYSIYVLIDIFSRRIIVTISRTAKADAVLLLIRRAILEWGVPETIKTDNGSDFTAHAVRRAFASLQINHELCDPFSPEQKGTVERAIGTLQRDLMPLLPGFVGHSVADRKRIEARKSFASRLGESDEKAFCVQLTADELQITIDRWVDARYSQKPHAGIKGQTPFERAASCRAKQRTIENDRVLDMLLAPVPGTHGLRTVTKNGLRVDGGHFIAAGLLPGEKVLVRHDPQDMGRVYVFSEDGTEFLCEAICPERAGVDPAAAVAAARAAQARMIEDEVEPLRRAARRIKPTDMVDGILGQDELSSATLTPLPKPSDNHETPQMAAALDAAKPKALQLNTELSPEQEEMHQRLVAELSGGGGTTGTEKVVRLPESAKSRFRRAHELELQLEAGEQINTDDALWLGGYQTTPEYRAHVAMFEDFGEDWLLAEQKSRVGSAAGGAQMNAIERPKK